MLVSLKQEFLKKNLLTVITGGIVFTFHVRDIIRTAVYDLKPIRRGVMEGKAVLPPFPASQLIRCQNAVEIGLTSYDTSENSFLLMAKTDSMVF